MQAGKVLVAEHNGAYIIKFLGDVRLTLCTTIDEYVDQMFSNPHFMSVVIDLAETEGIDSTSLGLLAKLAIQAKKRHQLVPAILSTNPNITRLLDSMGFRHVFDIKEDEILDDQELGALPAVTDSEEHVREKVIEAHRVLMGMNEQNRAAFSDLVSTLESSR